MVAAGVLTPEQVYRAAISWDTLVLLAGTGYAQCATAPIPPAIRSLASVYRVLRLAFRRGLAQAPRVDAHLPEPPLHRAHAALCLGALIFVVAGFLAGYDLAWTAVVG